MMNDDHLTGGTEYNHPDQQQPQPGEGTGGDAATLTSHDLNDHRAGMGPTSAYGSTAVGTGNTATGTTNTTVDAGNATLGVGSTEMSPGGSTTAGSGDSMVDGSTPAEQSG